MPHVVGGVKVIHTYCSDSSEIELPVSCLLEDIELPNSYGLLDDDEISEDKDKR